MHLYLLIEQDIHVHLSKQRHFSLGFNVAMSKQKCFLQLGYNHITNISSLALHVVYAATTEIRGTPDLMYTTLYGLSLNDFSPDLSFKKGKTPVRAIPKKNGVGIELKSR